ncbi:MAG: hypothetical protein GWP91_21755 [Rhodobacterales bacterium]|nr:hypothetical protein [Rhodobacterales bacterium]
MWTDTPEISSLLDQIEAHSISLYESTPADSSLEALYKQLGRLVHAQLRGERPLDALQDDREPTANVDRTAHVDEREDLDEEGWYPVEIPLSNVAFFTQDELEDIEREPDTEEVDRAALAAPKASRTLVPTPPKLLLHTFAKQQRIQGSDLHALHFKRVTWRDELTGLIGWQRGDMTPQQSSDQLQWICSDIDIRMFNLPKTIQAATIGWLAASLRAVTDEIGDDEGRSLAIDRLRRYRTQANLAPLIALTHSPLPEKRSWRSDAREWRRLLTPRGDPS